MNWRDVVYLIPIIKVKNTFGGFDETEGEQREVMANQKSVKGSEFYQAFAVGLRPEIVFEIKKVEYNREPRLQHEGTTYHVIRTYSKNGEDIDLTCSVNPVEGLGNG